MGEIEIFIIKDSDGEMIPAKTRILSPGDYGFCNDWNHEVFSGRIFNMIGDECDEICEEHFGEKYGAWMEQ